MTDEQVEAVARGLTKARRDAVRKREEKLGCFPLIVMLTVTTSVAMMFGNAASLWLVIGAFLATIFCLWEVGRNSQLEERAVRDWLLKNKDDV